jgi:maltose O-acetyltransferase
MGELARKVRHRASANLSRVPSRALALLATAVLRLEEEQSVAAAWSEAKSRRLMAALSSCGDNVMIQHPITVAGASEVRIGDDVSIAAYVHIWGHGGVTIGDRVMIGTHTSITSLTHDYGQATMRSTVVGRPITIGDDVWIGSNCVILPGISLGPGCVVGAGSVVTKNVDQLAIVSGVPARVIGHRPHEADRVGDV